MLKLPDNPEMKSQKLILSFLILILFGLFLYLPFLGEKEFQGEEGRRVLIALQMLEKGEFLIPTLFDEPYFNKPPLFNWALAVFFALTGDFSEFTARTLSSLALILTSLFLSHIWVRTLEKERSEREDLMTSLLPGLIFLTIPEVIDKALRAEIDALYASLLTIALFGWFYLAEVKALRIRAYILSGLFLGLAILTKTFQALLFFYIALIPYLIWQRRIKELFSLPALMGLCTTIGVFLLWAIPVSFKVGLMPFIKAWIMEYFSAAKAQEMTFWQHLEAYTLSAVISFSPWIFFLFTLRNKAFKEFLKTHPLLLKLFYFSLFLFVISYLLHFLFPGARLRYMLPSIGGLVYLIAIVFFFYLVNSKTLSKTFTYLLKIFCLLNILFVFVIFFYLQYINITIHYSFYFLSIVFIALNIFFFLQKNYYYKNLFILLIVFIFFAKHFFVISYYPYHQKNMNYFRKATFEIAGLIGKDKTFYLCKTIPHHLVYYLKYKHRFVQDIRYLRVCDNLPESAYILIQDKDVTEELLKRYQNTPIFVRNKKYYLIRM